MNRSLQIVALMATLALPMLAGASTRPTASATALPSCTTATLRATLGETTGGVGSVFTTLILLNVGSTVCTVQGYPGVSLIDRYGRQIGHPASRTPATSLRLTLQPGATASTVIHTLNPGVGTTNCLSPSAALRVYPPDQRAALLVPATLSECLGVMEVRPLVAGLPNTTS